MRRVFTAAIIILVAAVGARGVEAVVYRQVSTRTSRDAVGKKHTETLEQTLYVADNVIRTETKGFNAVTIYRTDKGVIYQFDPKQKVMASVNIKDVTREVEEYKKVLRATYKDMSRDKQEKLAVALGKVRARAKVMEKGRNIEIAGYPARWLTFYENGRLRLELWVTDKFETRADLSEMVAATGELSRDLIKLWRRQRGFALKSKLYPVLERSPEVENEVVEVERKEVPDELFNVPEGYKRVEVIKEAPVEEGEPGGAGDVVGEEALPLPLN